MLKTKRTLLSLALATAATAPLAQADDGFQLSEKLSVTGFIDMSWTHTDADGEDSEQSAGLDQFEIDFLYSFNDKLKAQVDIEYQDGAADEVDLEQAFITYAVNDNITVKAGRFLSYSGWETEEPTGLFQFSGTGYAPIFYGYYQQGVSVMYSGDSYALAASAITDLDDPEARDSEQMATEFMAALMPTDSITMKVFSLSDKIDGTDEDKEKFNFWTSYSEGPLTLAAEFNKAENSYALGTESDGYLLMGNYAFDSFGLTLRYHEWEVENDAGAVIEEMSGITVSPSFPIDDNLLLVLEYRMDENELTGEDVNTFAVEALMTF